MDEPTLDAAPGVLFFVPAPSARTRDHETTRRSPSRRTALTLRCVCALLALFALANARAMAGSGPSDWPEAPPVVVEWQGRSWDHPVTERFLADNEWELVGDRRRARVTKRINNVAFIVWFEQHEGVDATRVTVSAINGFVDVGPRYFKRYIVEVGDRKIMNLVGRHVIIPRGALIRRTCVGPDEAQLAGWNFVTGDLPLPAWVAASTEEDTARRISFPFRDLVGQPVQLGPYNFFWQNVGFSDSHGGWGIGPFHGGPDDWLTSPEGRRNREAEMLLEFQRPIWMLDDDFEPLVLEIPYWMGRTVIHEPAEFRYTVDDWCSYAEPLSQYQFHDLTHLSRGTCGAAALADWDSFAVECLGAVLQDFKMAHSLTRVVGLDGLGNPQLHPGALQDNPLLYPLWKKIETTDGPRSHGGNRALAHSLRLLRWCRGHFPVNELRPWDEALRRFARRLADEHGVTNAGSSPDWVAFTNGPLSSPLRVPYCQAFHQQLVTYELLEFGGLEDLGEASADFLTPHPPAYFELRRGEPGDTVFERGNSVTDQDEEFWTYSAYGNFTHDALNGWKDAFEFLAGMEPRGVNDGSQDLDCTPRHLWQYAVQ